MLAGAPTLGSYKIGCYCSSVPDNERFWSPANQEGRLLSLSFVIVTTEEIQYPEKVKVCADHKVQERSYDGMGLATSLCMQP
ncbi:hypothetical protein RB195_001959 [Necator americanus]|uniref:Uncharacterized protein n=1 Tax=Necator americanus TaxID=51031 RepID=A0ABR1DGQ7_NECAM